MKLPDLVRSRVARQVISATRPSKSPTRIQWPTLNGRSLWMERPANAFPSVSCRAKPTTTAPTADVVSNCSLKTNVATMIRAPMTIASWTMAGKRSRTRSDSKRVDQPDDQQVDDGSGEREALERADRRRRIGYRRAAELRADNEDDVERDVAKQKEQRELELPLDQRIDGGAPNEERRGKSRDAHEQMRWIVGH